MDREKVVKGLKELRSYFRSMAGIASSEQGRENHTESARMIEDALALLKAQEAIRPGIGIIHNDDGSKSYFLHCPIDGTTLDEGDRYCRKCGRAVKWDA